MHQTHVVQDLNLLTTFRLLLATGSVTATAERMRLSQPAVSRALGRLRAQLNDPLFVRTQGRLVPTPRAAQLGPELEALLGRLDDLLASGAGFDPASSTRTFVVATSDYTALVLVGPLLARLHREAPSVTVRVVQTVPDAEAALTDGTWDVLWAPQRSFSQAIVWTKLFDEDFAFVLRAGHPLSRPPLTLERYLSVPQIALSPEGKPGNPLDAQLERMGFRRRVVAHVSTFASVPPLVATSDFGAVLPRRVIAQQARAWGLVSRPLPFELRGFTLKQAWHVRHRHDAGHAWFRQLVAGLVHP
ncbi:MAG: LysR family transcriptional regulator [Myxococcaceae bacterium]|jgi:DNA-binding transcriptional LysR family regulator|nr:LysR family transcriptional regulator [Myxococcaceae bacterium]